MSAKMKAVQISKAGGDWELVECDVTEPNPNQVQVRVAYEQMHSGRVRFLVVLTHD